MGRVGWLHQNPVQSGSEELLDTPRLPGSQLHPPLVDCYKIKLRGVGHRLVYLVRNNAIPPDIVVLVVGRRDGGIYEAAAGALESARKLDE